MSVNIDIARLDLTRRAGLYIDETRPIDASFHRSTNSPIATRSALTMPQLATSMSVPLSCPLYLDMNSGLHSETNFKSPFEMQDNSKNSMLDMSFLYENLMKNQSNMYHFNPSLLAESFNFYLNQSCRNGDKSASPKSFSIESILGFPSASPTKDVFCNQLSFSEFPVKNGHYSVPEYVTSTDNYRPPVGHVHESCKVKGKQSCKLDCFFTGLSCATGTRLSSN